VIVVSDNATACAHPPQQSAPPWRFVQNGHWTEVRVNGDRSVDDLSRPRLPIAGMGVLLKSAIDLRRRLVDDQLVRFLPDWNTESTPALPTAQRPLYFHPGAGDDRFSPPLVSINCLIMKNKVLRF